MVDDGSEVATKALHLAINLVRARECRLRCVIAVANPEDAAEQRERRICELLSYGRKAEFSTLRNPVRFALIHALRILGPGLVVMPCSGKFGTGADVCDLVNELPNPILLVH